VPPWWRELSPRRLAVGMGATFLAMPIVIADLLPADPGTPQAVETVAPVESAATAPDAPVILTTTTAAPTTTTPPTTAAPTTTAPPTTAAPTTTAHTHPATTTPPTTAPPTTAPPTTQNPPPPPSNDSRSVEEIIRAHFGAAGDAAVEVARCESSLNPSARNPAGPGYYGLFQISRDHAASFQAVTGRSFDSAWNDPDANSQYARYLYNRSGWDPWPGCGP
jgi:hypothetical protein